MSVRTVDLFCSGGGSSWGARHSGAEIVCGVDAWDLAHMTYRDNFPEANSVNAVAHSDAKRPLIPIQSGH